MNETQLSQEATTYQFKLPTLKDIKESESKYNVLELFSGAGGMALGLHKAGFHPIALVDKDRDANRTVRHNFPKWNVVEADINELADEGIHTVVDENTHIDVLTGGFPCQPFSYAGRGAGLQDARGTVFYSLAKIIREVSPKAFLLENVRGLLSHDKGNTISVMKDILESLGYSVEYKVLNSWDYSVPQKRQRVFIVGVDSNYEHDFSWPKEHIYKPLLKDVLFDVPKSEGSQYSENKREILELVPPGGCWVDLPEEIAKEYMGKSYYSGGGRRGMARRMSYDEASLTLTTSPAQKQTERCHPAETRPFSVREYARIQTFPDDYEFTGSVSAMYRQIGNAVPVNLAYEMGVSMRTLLEDMYRG